MVESRYHELVQVSPVGIFRTDAKGRTTYVNPRWCELSGLAESEALGDGWLAAVHPADRGAIAKGWDRAAADRRVSRAEYRFVRPDGGIVWVVGLATPELAADGRVLGYIGTITDITEHRWLERELRKKNRSLGVLVSCGQALARAADEAALLDSFCRVAGEVGGYSGACVALVGADGSVRVASRSAACPASLAVAAFDSAASRKPIVRLAGAGVDIALPLLSGSSPLGSFAVSAADPEEVDAAEFLLLGEVASELEFGVCTQRAAREREAAEAQIVRLNGELDERVRLRTEQLSAANAELESFCYSVSHDLRAPLRAIGGFSEIIARRHRQSLDEEGRHYFDNIVLASERMSRLIDDLLEYSRVGRKAVQLSPVPLDETFAPLVSQFAPRAAATGGSLVVQPGLPIVLGNRTLLGQIFTNLIDNAIVYRKKGEPARVSVACQIRDGRAILSVADEGIGIAPEYHEKIFRVFQRLHGDDEYPGTGIGLASVKKAVEILQGRVWVESELGKGSAFYVELHRGDR
jgi:PAS domain S-box